MTLYKSDFLEFILGHFDYYRFPGWRDYWNGPLNGQLARQQLFYAIVKSIAPAAIVETGTYRGTTTAMFARTGLPVFTIELDARNYGFAHAHLRAMGNVTMHMGDSRDVLRKLFRGALAKFSDRSIFFYLDAHWNQDLPLAQEIDIAFTHAPNAIVMIDDFEVPFDSGYGFDDYGKERALTASYIAPAARKHALAMFYPSIPSTGESGAKRGCIVLCKASIHDTALASLELLCSEK